MTRFCDHPHPELTICQNPSKVLFIGDTGVKQRLKIRVSSSDFDFQNVLR